MVEIGGILEMVADCGREVVILYEVDLPDDWLSAVEAGYEAGEAPELCAICEEEITAGEPFVEYEKRPGYFYRHSDCGLPWQ